jgi:hypothetical protein
MKKYLLPLACISVVIVACVASILRSNINGEGAFYANLKCPDDYSTVEEQTAAVDAWTNHFFDQNPHASLGDWARARKVFYEQKNCTLALGRVSEAEQAQASSSK